MPKLKITNKNERLRHGFVNGIKAQAVMRGFSIPQLKRCGSQSYGTTNNRIEKECGDITVNDLICFAMALGISFDELVIFAAKSAAEEAGK